MASLVRTKACPSDFWKNAPLLNFASPKAFWTAPKAGQPRQLEEAKEFARSYSPLIESTSTEDPCHLELPNEKGNQNEQAQPLGTNRSIKSVIADRDTNFLVVEANDDACQPTTQTLKVASEAIFSFWCGMVKHFGGESSDCDQHIALLPDQGLLEILEILALCSSNQQNLSEVFGAVRNTPFSLRAFL